MENYKHIYIDVLKKNHSYQTIIFIISYFDNFHFAKMSPKITTTGERRSRRVRRFREVCPCYSTVARSSSSSSRNPFRDYTLGEEVKKDLRKLDSIYLQNLIDPLGENSEV